MQRFREPTPAKLQTRNGASKHSRCPGFQKANCYRRPRAYGAVDCCCKQISCASESESGAMCTALTPPDLAHAARPTWAGCWWSDWLSTYRVTALAGSVCSVAKPGASARSCSSRSYSSPCQLPFTFFVSCADGLAIVDTLTQAGYCTMNTFRPMPATLAKYDEPSYRCRRGGAHMAMPTLADFAAPLLLQYIDVSSMHR